MQWTVHTLTCKQAKHGLHHVRCVGSNVTSAISHCQLSRKVPNAGRFECDSDLHTVSFLQSSRGWIHRVGAGKNKIELYSGTVILYSTCCTRSLFYGHYGNKVCTFWYEAWTVLPGPRHFSPKLSYLKDTVHRQNFGKWSVQHNGTHTHIPWREMLGSWCHLGSPAMLEHPLLWLEPQTSPSQ